MNAAPDGDGGPPDDGAFVGEARYRRSGGLSVETRNPKYISGCYLLERGLENYHDGSWRSRTFRRFFFYFFSILFLFFERKPHSFRAHLRYFLVLAPLRHFFFRGVFNAKIDAPRRARVRISSYSLLCFRGSFFFFVYETNKPRKKRRAPKKKTQTQKDAYCTRACGGSLPCCSMERKRQKKTEGTTPLSEMSSVKRADQRPMTVEQSAQKRNSVGRTAS